MKKKRCFVIMPFSETKGEHTEAYWTNHFQKFLKPLIEQSGEFETDLSEALRGDILKEIIKSLTTAPVVVADLTDHNSNVYWELGIRQSFKHGTITIAETGTKLPFDLGTKGTLFYHPGDHIKNSEFAKDFIESLSDCIQNPDRPDSHVLETISGRGSIYSIIRQEESKRRISALISELSFNKSVFDRIEEIMRKNKEIRQIEVTERDERMKKMQDRFRTIDLKFSNIEREMETLMKTNISILNINFRVSALDLLVIQRYYDHDIEFYSLAEMVLSYFNILNERMKLWSSDGKVFENWFLEKIEIRDSISKFITEIEDIFKILSEKEAM